MDNTELCDAKDSLQVPGLAELVTNDDGCASMGTYGRREETKKQKDTRLRGKKMRKLPIL